MMNLVREKLSKNNYTLTQQRVNIINYMMSQSKHYTIKEICDSMESPYASQATIYRNLKLFHEIGLCNKTRIKGETYYELQFTDQKSHYHFKCEKCHKIVEIPTTFFNDTLDELGNTFGLKINDHHICLSGICSECRESMNGLKSK